MICLRSVRSWKSANNTRKENFFNMKIPKKIRIGGHDIIVDYVDRIPEDKLGQICLAEGKITIAKNFLDKKQSETSMVNTFIHEVTHGILDVMDDKLSYNEKFVSTFSSFLVDVVEEIVKTNKK